MNTQDRIEELKKEIETIIKSPSNVGGTEYDKFQRMKKIEKAIADLEDLG